MTGEVTLRGKVLAVGGVKDKALAAHRAGIAHVALPSSNIKDLEELPEEVREAVTFHPLTHVDELLSLALIGFEPAPLADEAQALARRWSGVSAPPPTAMWRSRAR